MKDPAEERAPRFPLDIVLRYRAQGMTRWCDGRTENLSRSGILFRAPEAVKINTRIEMVFDLPMTVPPAPVACRGRVVRVIPATDEDPSPAIAATISAYGDGTDL